MATPEDLAETVKEVEALDRRIVAAPADVRDYDALKQALDEGVAQLGRLDIVSANAGIVSYGRAEELPEQIWRDMIDTSRANNRAPGYESSRMRSAAIQATAMVGAWVLPATWTGSTEASTIRSPVTPRTRNSGSTTSSVSGPMALAPTAW
jgi:NAD(P)-dependent dehydrogenase (short-subunit alcohol dehydrogenase family)